MVVVRTMCMALMHVPRPRTAKQPTICAMQDATSSIDVLRSLSRLAGCGMNVVTVIHQPRYALYELLDSLLLLGVGGITVYNGPPLLTEAYFRLHGFAMRPYDNVADFNLDVVSGRVSKAGDPFFKKESLPCAPPQRACCRAATGTCCDAGCVRVQGALGGARPGVSECAHGGAEHSMAGLVPSAARGAAPSV